MPSPPYPCRPRYFLSGYVRDLLHTNAIAAIGADAFAILVIIAEAEEATGQKGPVLFWNSQLQAGIGAKTWRGLDNARQRAIDAGYLHYESMGTRAQGSYWVDMPPLPPAAITCANDHNTSRITCKNDGNHDGESAITASADHNPQGIYCNSAGNPTEAASIAAKIDDHDAIIGNFDDNPPGSGAIIGNCAGNTHQQAPIIVKKDALPNKNTNTPPHTPPRTHARADEPGERPPPLRTWTLPRDLQPELVEAIDAWQRFQLGRLGRPDPDVRIEVSLSQKLSAGWSVRRIVEGIKIAIDKDAKSWCDPEKTFDIPRGPPATRRPSSTDPDDTDVFGGV